MQTTTQNEQSEMFIRFGEDTPLIIVYRTGKYIITDGGSYERLYRARDNTVELFSKLDVISPETDTDFRVNNIVCVDNVKHSINLNELMIRLGMEAIEHEPEQFPGLVYRPEDSDVTLLVFGSGKMVLTGSDNIDNVETALESLKSEFDESGEFS